MNRHNVTSAGALSWPHHDPVAIFDS